MSNPAPVRSLRAAVGAAQRVVQAEAIAIRRTADWVRALPAKARRLPLADPSPGPPPPMPDLRQVMADARRSSLRVGGITAGLSAWKESVQRYREYKAGEPITFGKVWESTVRVGLRSLQAGQFASRRHLAVVGLNSLARVVAWQSARRAAKSSLWKFVFKVSNGVAGNAARIFLAVTVFRAMSSDIQRYREGDLSENDFYRNCALTGLWAAAPAVGASMGPAGATAGLVVAVGAGMMRK